MNEGMWIVVTDYHNSRQVAVNLRYVMAVRENDYNDVYNGKRSTIDFSDGSSMDVYESFDEIGAMIR